MSCKGSYDELLKASSEQKKAKANEAELLIKIYDWFIEICAKNTSQAKNIAHQDMQQIFNMTSENAKDIESRTGLIGLSDLVIERNKILEKISKQDHNLCMLWLNTINDLSNK